MSGDGFLSKNISGFTHALESVILTEDICRLPGLFQRLDSRLKVASSILFIIIVGLARNYVVLVTVLALILILSYLSRIPPGLFLKRVLLFIPIFTLVIAIPALFITPGEPLVHLGDRVIITEQGVRTAGFLVLRVTDSLSMGVLLILTTPWEHLLASMRWFRIPSVFVDVLGMTYRYIFLLLHSANSMFLSRRSRTLGGFSSGENRRWLGRALGATLVRSQYLSEEVYLAMLSRGYQGEVRILSDFKLNRRDYSYIVLALLLAGLLLWGNSLW